MTVSESISKKISEEFKPIHFEVINESHLHHGPRTESHFKLILVSEKFHNLPLVKRHKLVNKCLENEVQLIHALSLKLFTPEEWIIEKDQVEASPKCPSK